MKVAIAASGNTLDAPTDPRFGRCNQFMIVDTDTMQYTVLDNTAAMQGSGAGIAAVQLVANAGADAVIAANFGPNAFQALSAGGLKIYSFAGGTVAQAVEALKAGTLTEISDANVPSHFGMNAGGGGMGGGGGRGMGGGGGMGGGRGCARGGGFAPPCAPDTDELARLKDHAQSLENQLQELQKRIGQLEGRQE